jgi:dTMP kinase
MERGIFITLEGGEGTGKSTLIHVLSQHLESLGRKVCVTREPGGSVGAELIRGLLVTGPQERWDPLTEYLLLSAARRDHCQKTIIPKLAEGWVVLCDRFFDSSLAYQGWGHGLDPSMMDQVYQWISGNLNPDVTFLLDLDPELGLKRSLSRTNHEARYEELGLDFHKRVRQGFLIQAQRDSSRYHILDASLDAQEVAEKAFQILSTYPLLLA